MPFFHKNVLKTIYEPKFSRANKKKLRKLLALDRKFSNKFLPVHIISLTLFFCIVFAHFALFFMCQCDTMYVD